MEELAAKTLIGFAIMALILAVGIWYYGEKL